MRNGTFLRKTLWANRTLQEVTGKLRLRDKKYSMYVCKCTFGKNSFVPEFENTWEYQVLLLRRLHSED